MPAASVIPLREQGTSRPESRLIRPLHRAQEQPVAEMLTRAFETDPLVRAICDAGPGRVTKQMRWSFRLALRGHCLSPQPAWTISDPGGNVAGVALVSRPSMSVQGPTDVWFSLRVLLHVGLGAVRRGMQAAETIAAQAPPEPYTYLRTLGVDPSSQGRGFGSDLVRHVITASPAAWPVYLETAKEANLQFYARHGLQCVGEFRCLGVRIWRLLRPASRPTLRVDLRRRPLR